MTTSGTKTPTTMAVVVAASLLEAAGATFAPVGDAVGLATGSGVGDDEHTGTETTHGAAWHWGGSARHEPLMPKFGLPDRSMPLLKSANESSMASVRRPLTLLPGRKMPVISTGCC